MANKRKLKNWLTTFLDWTKPVSEAPESMLVWSGLFAMASVMKRDVRFSTEYTRLYEIYPTTYLMFVGGPGVVKKSTSAGYVERLILKMNEKITVTDSAHVNIGPSSGSHVAIMEKMSQTIDGSMTIISGEFGNIVSTMPEETYDFFARMFDNPSTYEHLTRKHGSEAVIEPSLNVFGCTTPDWIAENTGYMRGGGFAARTVFIFESSARQRALFYNEIGPSMKQMEKWEEGLIHDLQMIGNLEGEFEPESKEFAKEMNQWYVDYVDLPAERGTETFQQRKHVHTIRTAMMLSAAESDKLVVERRHFKAAQVLIDDVEKKLGREFSAMGKNPYAAALYTVLEYIEKTSPVLKGKVEAYFFADVPPEELWKIFEVLKASGMIEEVNDGSRIVLRIRKQK